MGAWETISKIFSTAWGDGSGKGLGFDQTLVAKSAAYNRMRTYANDVISSGVNQKIISQDKAKELSEALSSGKGNFNSMDEGSLNDIATKLINSDNDAVKTIGKNYTDNAGKYPTKSGDIDPTYADYAEFLGTNTTKGLGIKNMASGYFGDVEYGKARTKMAVGATAGVMVGARLLSGGDLFTTNTGERDIAGIPFI